jgi:hypothetical protein
MNGNGTPCRLCWPTLALERVVIWLLSLTPLLLLVGHLAVQPCAAAVGCDATDLVLTTSDTLNVSCRVVSLRNVTVRGVDVALTVRLGAMVDLATNSTPSAPVQVHLQDMRLLDGGILLIESQWVPSPAAAAAMAATPVASFLTVQPLLVQNGALAITGAFPPRTSLSVADAWMRGDSNLTPTLSALGPTLGSEAKLLAVVRLSLTLGSSLVFVNVTSNATQDLINPMYVSEVLTVQHGSALRVDQMRLQCTRGNALPFTGGILLEHRSTLSLGGLVASTPNTVLRIFEGTVVRHGSTLAILAGSRLMSVLGNGIEIDGNWSFSNSSSFLLADSTLYSAQKHAFRISGNTLLEKESSFAL